MSLTAILGPDDIVEVCGGVQDHVSSKDGSWEVEFHLTSREKVRISMGHHKNGKILRKMAWISGRVGSSGPEAKQRRVARGNCPRKDLFGSF